MLFALAVAFVLSLIPSSRKRKAAGRTFNPTNDRPCSTEEANISAMKKVVSEHQDCTAEVIGLNVSGRKHVETFRLLSPGNEVELRMKKGAIKVYAFGEYIAELITPADSNLPRLFEENVCFDAYLGGRDLAFLSNPTFDLCSIIVFYKLPGVAPTHVNLV